MTLTGVGRQHHQFGGIAHQRRLRNVGRPFAEADNRLGVGNARGAAQEHRGIELLARVECQLGEFQRFLAVGRLEHRHLGELGVVAAVLLVLRRVHPGVVGDHQHQPAAHAGVGQGEERVGGHVDADMLHGHHRAGAGEAGADSDLEGDLLVWRPGGVDFFVLRGVFENFGAWSAGISGSDQNACFIRTPGDGLIAGEKNFLHNNPCEISR